MVHQQSSNPEKSHLLITSAQEIEVNIGGMAISNSKCEKLLGIHTDSKLTTEPRIISLCKKTSQKLNAFTKIKFDQRKFLLNVFITSQFSYAAVIWTFHNRKLSNYINPTYERVLGIAYQDNNSTFDKLHAKESSFTLRDRNLQKFLMKYSTLK